MNCVLCGHNNFIAVFPHNGGRVKKCNSCGLVQVVPRPTGKDIEELYHEDFDHFAPYIEQIEVHRKYFRKKLLQVVAEVSASWRIPTPNLSLLDIGCALGVLLEEAQKQGIEAYGIDVSADAVVYCKKKGLNVFQGNLATAKLPRGKQFDIVTAFEVIEHEQEPLSMIRRVYKLLKKGGIAILTTPNHGSLWRKIMGKWWVGYRHPEHINFFDKRSLNELFHRAGFSRVTVKKDPPRPFPLSFLFTRAADYFPLLKLPLRFIGGLFSIIPLPNPINPWDDILVVAQKYV